MSYIDHQYENLVQFILASGKLKSDRTGTGTLSVFGRQMRWDLSHGFPLITTKRVHAKSVVAELLWLLSGSTNVKDLQAMGCTIWDEWASASGDLGPVYGAQWRSWQGPGGRQIDQIKALVDGLRRDPTGRRHLVSAWAVHDLPSMALSPCHAFFQVDVTDSRLSLQVYQRSADVFLGVPFNIASYALLATMLAQQTGYFIGDLIWTGGDCHLYHNHLEQAHELLSRKPRPFPQLQLVRAPDIFSYTPEHVSIVGYDPHPPIKAPVAV